MRKESANWSYWMAHENVDLGLSVNWAACNLGACAADDCGDYYANCQTECLDYYHPDEIELHADEAGDTASAKWGMPWRLPTRDELQELVDNCDWQKAERNGHGGYLVTSRINGNSIFLPAAGCRREGDLEDCGLEGYYWSSTQDSDLAFALCFNDAGVYVFSIEKAYGRSVRPVCPK